MPALLGLARYDALLAIALATQAWLLWRRLETPAEARAIALFHVAGFALEAFKVSAPVHAWVYPDPALTKVLGVPLFSGFMYAAVGSYVMQAGASCDCASSAIRRAGWPAAWPR